MLGKSGATGCDLCAAGWACPGGAAGIPPFPCPPGKYTPGGAAACALCPAGKYCPGGRNAQSCSPGTFSSAGAATCTYCPAGTLAAGSGATECYSCQLSFPSYYSAYGSSTCEACLGHSPCCDYYGLCPSEDFVCSPGQAYDYQINGCRPCRPGYSCPGGISFYATEFPCAPGTYSVGGASICTNCDPGWYTIGEGATTCLQCPYGSACPGGATVDHLVTCTAGTFRTYIIGTVYSKLITSIVSLLPLSLPKNMVHC